MAEQVKSPEGYYFAIRLYVAGFRDAHLNVSSDLVLKPRWPGALIAFRNGRFEIRKPHERLPIKSLVIGRETVAVRELMLRNIFAYAGRPSLEASWIDLSPWLLVDLGNPWVKRPDAWLEETSGIRHRLRWRPIEMSALSTIIEDAQFGAAPGFAIREFADDSVWVSVPTFRPKGEKETTSLKKIINSLPSLRRARIIVFDVRGNRGGNSQWGSDLVRALYGDSYYGFRSRRLRQAGTSVEWRVSQGNESYVHSRAREIEREFGRSSPVVKMMKTVYTEMRQARREGRTFCQYRDPDTVTPTAKRCISPVKSQVFLLTDGRCGSSCLDFADELFAMKNVRHVGFPTNADSGYADVRGEVLPSGLSRLTFAMKVYRKMFRGVNEPYIVQERWTGEISDTAALQRWILELAGVSAAL